MRVRTIAAACIAAAAVSLCVSATIQAAETRPDHPARTAAHEPNTALNASHSLVGCAGLIAALLIYRAGRRR